MQTFGAKLHILRTQHGLTLKELALALGYTAHGHISEIEAGKKRPTVEFVLNVARLFKVSTDQLLREEITIYPVGAQTKQPRETLMPLPFVNRPPTQNELQKLRLVLSTYQDGTGQLAARGGKTLPGWRDFERSVALVFGGQAQENKAIFDVLLPDPVIDVMYGLSCKMRDTLGYLRRTGRATLELSNSNGRFWAALSENGITNAETLAHNPEKAGQTILRVVESWHDEVSIAKGGKIDIAKSFYLVLQWQSSSGEYQLFQFTLNLPDPQSLNWQVPGERKRLVGYKDKEMVFEWYHGSGGQLKYYPPVASAIWASECFHLEPLPETSRVYGVLRKVSDYYPDLWTQACKEP